MEYSTRDSVSVDSPYRAAFEWNHQVRQLVCLLFAPVGIRKSVALLLLVKFVICFLLEGLLQFLVVPIAVMARTYCSSVEEHFHLQSAKSIGLV